MKGQLFTRTILKEDAESTSQKKAMEYAVKVMGLSDESADEYVRKTIRLMFPYLNGNRKAGKYTMGLLRLSNTDAKNRNDRMKLNSMVEILTNNSELYTKYDRNFNGKSFKDLEEDLKDFITTNKEDTNETKEKPESKNYEIIKIDDYETANLYEHLVSWCICASRERLESYGDKGMSQFYFCFHKDLKNFKDDDKVVLNTSNGHKLNGYALSALAICVNPDGSLKSCTTRLNHDYDCEGHSCCDHELTIPEIEEVLGVDFKETFKPNDKASIMAKEYDNIKEAFKKIDKFSNLCYLGRKYKNYIKNYEYEDEDVESKFYIVNFEDNSCMYYQVDSETLENDGEGKMKFAFIVKYGSRVVHPARSSVAYYVEDGLLKCYDDGNIKNIISVANYNFDNFNTMIYYSHDIDSKSIILVSEDIARFVYNKKLDKIFKFDTNEKPRLLDCLDGVISIRDKNDMFRLFDTKTLKYLNYIENYFKEHIQLSDMEVFGDYYGVVSGSVGILYNKNFEVETHLINLTDRIIYVPSKELVMSRGRNGSQYKVNIESYVEVFRDDTYYYFVAKDDKGKIFAYVENGDNKFIIDDIVTVLRSQGFCRDYNIVKTKDGKCYNLCDVTHATGNGKEYIEIDMSAKELSNLDFEHPYFTPVDAKLNDYKRYGEDEDDEEDEDIFSDND